jgi:nicotinamidase-related amidase
MAGRRRAPGLDAAARRREDAAPPRPGPEQAMSKIERWRGIIPEDDLATYAKGAFGNGIGLGQRPALLNIDTTRMFVDPAFPQCGGPTDALQAALVHVTETFRRLRLPIYYSRRDDRSQRVRRGLWNEKLGLPDTGAFLDSYAHDSRADDWPDAYAPRREDCVILKNKPSCFFGTPLESFLRYEGVDSLVVVGTATSGCVRAAVVDAFSHNFRVMIPEEAVGDRSPTAHRVNLFDMDMKYADVEPIGRVIAAVGAVAAAR